MILDMILTYELRYAVANGIWRIVWLDNTLLQVQHNVIWIGGASFGKHCDNISKFLKLSMCKPFDFAFPFDF